MHALQFAARLAGERDEDVTPSPEFLRTLRSAMALEAQGKPKAATSRRGLLAAAVAGLATGITGFLAGRFSAPQTETPAQPTAQVAPPSQPAMVRDNGHWFAVAKLSELKEKQVVRFTAGSVEGHLVKYGHKVHALSAICSHLPCTLSYREGSNDFLCPCHDVAFNTRGEAVNVRRPLDPLTPIQVSINGDDVLVWSIGEVPKSAPRCHASTDPKINDAAQDTPSLRGGVLPYRRCTLPATRPSPRAHARAAHVR